MKNRTVVVLIALMLVSFTLACTIPSITVGSEPVEKIVYVEITSTPDVISDSTDEDDTDSEDVAVTPPVPVNLDGPWTIWQGSAEQQLNIDFLQQGGDLTGNTATGGGQSILFKGVLSLVGTSVTGTWENTSGTSGNFTMYLTESLSSFSGNLGGGVPFCGTRTGTSKPNPCLK